MGMRIETGEFAVELQHATPDAETQMGYVARVSSPNQEKPGVARLLSFCIKHGHWSVFEQAHMTVEIETSRMITQQILRHWSFRFQEFSQRYAALDESGVVSYEARRQASKNRQSSVDDLSEKDKAWWREAQKRVWEFTFAIYAEGLDRDIAKECARAVLPIATKSRIYMTGNVRSWIHYIQLRTPGNVQKEHRDIANAIKEIFCKQFPIVSKALEWV